MKCDRCREQLPVGDGVDQNGQTLCLECRMLGQPPTCNPIKLRQLENSVTGYEHVAQSSLYAQNPQTTF
jgi:hypothetical protein